MKIILADLRAAGLSEAQILQVIEASDIRETEKRHSQLREASRKYRDKRHQNHDDHHERDDRASSLPSTTINNLKVQEERLEIVALAKKWPRDFREQFWAAYPKKVEKPYALKCLEKVMRSGAEFDAVMAGVGRIDRADPKYIKNPSTWLNRGCWTDGEGATAEFDKTDYALLELHRQSCLAGGHRNGSIPRPNGHEGFWGNTGPDAETADNVSQLRPAGSLVRKENQKMG